MYKNPVNQENIAIRKGMIVRYLFIRIIDFYRQRGLNKLYSNFNHLTTETRMKFLSFFLSFFLMYCSQPYVAQLAKTDDDTSIHMASVDSINPYFSLNEDGSVWFSNSDIEGLRKNGVIDSLLLSETEWLELQLAVMDSIESNPEYMKKYARPLDYNCPAPMVALFNNYSHIKLTNGQVVVSDSILKSECEYVGYDCGVECGAEDDPYLKDVFWQKQKNQMNNILLQQL
jgi:hypothetical protein